MRIGVPAERMREEYRVGLTPEHVRELAALGHHLCVESNAGRYAGFTDEMYRSAGAHIGSHETAFDAHLVVKVKCPLREEYPLLRMGQTLFTYLHFDGNAPVEDILAIVDTGITGIAYEWVEEDGRYPLLEPMSRITGVLFARKALDLLLQSRLHLGGAYGLGGPRARALVIGSGHIGKHAIATLARNDVELVLVDKQVDTLDRRLHAVWSGWNSESGLRCIPFDEDHPEIAIDRLREELPEIDLLIGAAVRRSSLPKERCPYLVDHAAVATMRPGSVLCDATAEIRNFFETAVPTTGINETYEEAGVLHYNCEHIPSLAARTATHLLAAATFPYVRELASGVQAALMNDPALYRGTMCCAGLLTDALTAQKKDLPVIGLKSLLR